MKKRTRNIVAASAAVLAAAIVAFPAAMALVPGSGARYIDEDHYTGEVVTDEAATENASHDGHAGWTDLNEAVGTSTSYTISEGGKYYLSDDIEVNLTIGTKSTSSSGTIEVDLCLNGYMLSTPGRSTMTTPVIVGFSSGSSGNKLNVTVNLYDCGGGKSVHYYKFRDDGVSYTFYEVSQSGNSYSYADDGNGNKVPVSEAGADGYVRGGLITGGDGISDSGSGSGIQVKGYHSTSSNEGDGVVTLNMYGGTVAGNVTLYRGAGICVQAAKFNMYGGSIEGNNCHQDTEAVNEEYGGGGVGVVGSSSSWVGSASFTMYGGTIRNNRAGAHGGGVEVYSGNASYSAVFEMYGGVIDGNRAQYGGGVGMYDYYNPSSGEHATDAFRMYGGTIRDNTSVYGGGGIYVSSSGSEIEMSGGTITGNVQEEIESGASNRGGGIDFFNEDTMTLSGTAYVYGNYCAGQICNIGISDGHFLTFGDDGLADGARIGVTCVSASSGTQITTNYFDGTEAYFISDDRTFRVTANGTSYLQLTSKK